jgi:hypothetical protein
MTYTIQLLEPRVQKILEEFAQLNLIKFINTSDNIENQLVKPSKRKVAHLAGFAESIREMNAHAKGEIELPNMDAVLKAMAANKHI